MSSFIHAPSRLSDQFVCFLTLNKSNHTENAYAKTVKKKNENPMFIVVLWGYWWAFIFSSLINLYTSGGCSSIMPQRETILQPNTFIWLSVYLIEVQFSTLIGRDAWATRHLFSKPRGCKFFSKSHLFSVRRTTRTFCDLKRRKWEIWDDLTYSIVRITEFSICYELIIFGWTREKVGLPLKR